MGMKQKFHLIWGIVPIAILLSLMPVIASAASFDMELKLFQNLSTCPTILQDTPPLSKDDIPVYITNLYEYPDTFQLSLKLPSGWSGFVDPDFFVDANQRKQVDPLWITVPDTEPGFYPVEIKAVSGQTGDTVSKRFNVEVLSCHSARINIQEDYKEVCREKVDKAVFSVEMTNTGKDTETFDISVLKGGKAVEWATVSTPSLTLNAGETKEVEIFLELPEDLEGIQEFAVKARSQTSYATVVKSFKLKVKDCYDFNVFLRPAENDACLGDSAEYSLKIDNLGMSDVFKIEPSEWVSVEKTAEIPEKGSKELTLRVTPAVKGRTTFTVTVESVNDTGHVKEAKGYVNAAECRNLAVIVSPSKTAVCSGEKVALEVVVKNTGSVDEEIELSTDLGTLETDRVLLNPKEAKSIKLTVDTSEFTGDKTVTVTAKTDKITDTGIAKVSSENCYRAELYVEPKTVDVCPCREAEFMVTLKNTGRLPDNYTVLFDEVRQSVKLGPNETKVFKYDVPVSCNMTGTHSINVSAESAYFSYSDSAELNIKDMEKCYSVFMSNGKEIGVAVSKAVAEGIKVKNTGEIKDAFTFSVEGPSWLYLEPTSLELESGEEKYIYLYASPPLGTVPDIYSAKITGKSTHTESAFDLNIRVTGEGEVPVTGQAAKPNLTIGPSEGVTLNASMEYPEGEANVSVPGAAEGWKPVAIGVITIIIIMILIIRFVTLAK
jgi:uncharacterized membrane protein